MPKLPLGVRPRFIKIIIVLVYPLEESNLLTSVQLFNVEGLEDPCRDRGLIDKKNICSIDQYPYHNFQPSGVRKRTLLL